MSTFPPCSASGCGIPNLVAHAFEFQDGSSLKGGKVTTVTSAPRLSTRASLFPSNLPASSVLEHPAKITSLALRRRGHQRLHVWLRP